MPVLPEKPADRRRSLLPAGCLLTVLLALALIVVGLAATAGLGVWRLPVGGLLFSAGNDTRRADLFHRIEIEGLALDDRSPLYEGRIVSLGPLWWGVERPWRAR
jgi:hypothetical protein